MLDRIQLLQNVGNFDNVAAGTRLALQKLALFYAENGKGKTTLAAILRSLGLDDPHILEASIRVAYPVHFPPGSLLGRDFHAKCVQGRAAGTPILSEADTTELRALLDYANNFHHETNAAWETITINDAELTDFCTRTIRFTQRGQ
jgi:hypothetical protein